MSWFLVERPALRWLARRPRPREREVRRRTRVGAPAFEAAD
jgi:peptidoglycan/LPS O-acetylase OafA/YrhL